MLTIKEFLEARIAEDEMRARIADLDLPDGQASPSSIRALQECAVKRVIMSQWGPYEALDGPNLLAVMAAVYSSHPDYPGARTD